MKARMLKVAQFAHDSVLLIVGLYVGHTFAV